MNKNPQIKNKKGFSLMEVVIAMAVISIVFTIAMTSIAATAKARLRAFQSKYCVSEMSNLLECYKKGGSEKFEDSVLFYFGYDNPEFQEDSNLPEKISHVKNGGTKTDENGTAYTEYLIYYNSNFQKLETDENHVYRLIARVYSDGFSAQMIYVKSDDAVIFEMEKYQSRYDLVGGGA